MNGIIGLAAVKRVDLIIRRGLRNGATQIHLRQAKLTDGLEVVYQKHTEFNGAGDISERLAPVVIAHLKVMGNLDINTKVRVQHSKTRVIQIFTGKGGKDLRRYFCEIFIIPSEYGEGAIIQFISE